METKPKLLDQGRDKLRTKHYSYRTERQYIAWIRRFILHHDKRHPRDMSGREVEQFLTHLAVDRKVAAATQNQALAAILFLYRHVLETELPWLENVVRAKRPARLPVVLSAKDVGAVLDHLDGQFRLIGQLLYGGGLRLMEALRLRIKDIDFDYLQIMVRAGKGKKDRVGGTAHAPTLLRHAPAGARLRHPYGSGVDGTCRCPHRADLYARDEEGRKRREKSAELSGLSTSSSLYGNHDASA